MQLINAFNLYIDSHLSHYTRPKDAESYLRRGLALLGLERELETIEVQDVLAMHVQLNKRSQSSALRTLNSVKTFFNTLVRWGMLDKNPATPVRGKRLPPRTVALREDEMPRLCRAFEREKSDLRVYFIFVLVTGARLTEARRVLWRDLDLGAGQWLQPLTKNKTPHGVYLPPQLVDVLRTMPRTCEHVFATSHGKPWGANYIRISWERIKARAGLEHLWIHDLRRSKIWRLDAAGLPIQHIARTVNHRSISTTIRYLEGAPPSPLIQKAARADADLIFLNLLPPERGGFTGSNTGVDSSPIAS